MLNLLEKVQYLVSGLVVLAAAGLYLWRPPEYRPVDTLPDVKITPARPSTRPPKTGGGIKEAKPEVSPEDQAILDMLTKLQNVRLASKTLERNDCQVDAQTWDYVKREPNWTPELKKAKSALLPGADGRNTRLRLFEIEEGSLFKKLGVQEGDIVELIDGTVVDFESGYQDHIQLWKRLAEKMQNGGKVPLTITRGGKPVQLEFKLQP